VNDSIIPLMNPAARCWAWIALWLSVTAACGDDLLRSVGQVRALPHAGLASEPAVALRGVLTFHDPATGLGYLEDATGGVEVRGLPRRASLRVGVELACAGRIDRSRPIPSVVADPATIRFDGLASLPVPRRFGAEDLSTGGLDGRRVRIEAALVRVELSTERDAAAWLRLGLRTPFGFFTALVPWSDGQALPAHLLFSRVAVTGVAEGIVNNRGQRVGVLFLVPSLESVEVLRPPAPDPFERPTRGLSDLMRPGLDDPYDLVRVEGTVLYQGEEFGSPVFLRTREGAMQVELGGGDFTPGDRLAVVGYPVLVNKNVALRDAVARRLASGPSPEPLALSVDQLLREGSDSDLVLVKGVILRNALQVPRGSLFLESAQRVVEVALSEAFEPATRQRLAAQLPPGTAVEVTGVSELRGSMAVTGTVNLLDVHITARDPADIVISRAAPWWTTGRLLALAGGLAALVGLGAVWVTALRQRVRAQTEIIRDKIERETRWVERSRIARDIHDDVGSALTQISLLGDLGRRDLVVDDAVEHQFERISGQAREAVRALDEIVWTVNPRNDTLAGTVAYLNQLMEDMAEDAGLRCRFEIPEEVPEVPLNAKLRHNLLLAAKESAHNAIKHSGTKLLRVFMAWDAGSLTVAVGDEGRGFDPAATPPGRTGLDSMKRRMEEVGGEVGIDTAPGRPTTITFRVPLLAGAGGILESRDTGACGTGVS
jgi:signal transduction histidine kinase